MNSPPPRPPTGDLRLLACAPGYHGPGLARRIADLEPHQLRELKATPEGSVHRTRLESADSGSDLDAVIKTQRLGSLKRRLTTALGTGRAHRAFRAGNTLLAIGVRTAEPIALFRGLDRSEPVEVLLMRAVEGPTLLRLIAEPGRLNREEQLSTARAVGVQLRRMVEAGLYNRDHKPSNLLVPEPGRPPAIVDAVAIRLAPLRDRALRRMLVSLGTEPVGVGSPVPLGLAARCARAAGGPHLLRSVIREINAKPTTTPADDPLASGA